jgi:hypothetical protein
MVSNCLRPSSTVFITVLPMLRLAAIAHEKRMRMREWGGVEHTYVLMRERRDKDKGPSCGNERRKRGHVANLPPLGFKIL